MPAKKPAPKAKKASPKAAAPAAGQAASSRRSAVAAAKMRAKLPEPEGKPLPKARRRKEDQPEALLAADEGYQLAKSDAVKFLHSRRQAMFALARKYHLDADDIQQEGFEVLLTCLRDFSPIRKREDGTEHAVQFNTFFGVRLEGKALELRNRNPEYQARQAHLADLSDEQKAEFRNAPPLLVQHLDQTTSMQETLRGEVSSARRKDLANPAAKLVAEGFLEKKLNELIAQERDDKRRAALMHVKVGGVASFDEIAYHFGVTDSRASQILNELMDAFYIQRLIAGDVRSVLYDFQKLKFQPKRALRLLTESMTHAGPDRAAEIRSTFTAFCPEVAQVALPSGLPSSGLALTGSALPGLNTPFKDPFTDQENAHYPLRGLEWIKATDLTLLPVNFRGMQDVTEPPHITALMEREADSWPLIITTKCEVIDGARRLAAARARGKDKLLCMVRDGIDTATAMQLRVTLNLRQIRPDKMDLYWAICALADQGLSQQKIAAAIGTSRTNVIVYAKVKDKATDKLRTLFEDGLIQITNASSASDLDDKQQENLAAFIRTHGATWGKGPQFNELYEAVVTGKLAALVARQPKKSRPEVDNITPMTPLAPSSAASASSGAESAASVPATAPLSEAYRKRLNALEQALTDAETWATQREATITKQTADIVDLNAKVEALQRELSTHDLMKSADTATRDKFLKEIKDFYAVFERLAGAAYQVEKAAKQLRGQPLTHKQAIEINQQIEAFEKHLNSLRVETLNQRPKA